MKVLYWANIAIAREGIVRALGALPGVELDIAETKEQAQALLPAADGLVMANPSEQEAAVISSAMRGGARLRWMHLVSAGMDGVARCGLGAQVRVTHTPGATANAVGDHALALLLALMRALPAAWRQQQAREWNRPSLSPQATSVEGKTVVVLGYGAIGKYLVRVLGAMNATVRVVSRSLPAGIDTAAAFPLGRLEEALDAADALLCAIPLSEQTQGIVDARALRRMAAGSFVVNVGRGPVVERQGLIACLRDGHLRGAGLDVTDPEPLEATDELWELPNVIITPHYAGAGSRHAARRIAEAAEAAVRSALSL